MFADLWDKFGIEEIQTMNLAEVYHIQLSALTAGDHPVLNKLILVSRERDGEAESAVVTLQQNPFHTKHLLRKDRERRDRITHEMQRFNDAYQQAVSRVQIEEYCRTMARFVSDKTS